MFCTLLVDGSKLVQKERMVQKREEISPASEKLRRKRTQYTNWGNKGLVGAVLLHEKQRMWVQM